MKPPPKPPTHQTTLELSEPMPPEVEIGGDIVLRVRARCAIGCDLSVASVRVVAAEETIASSHLFTPDEADAVSETHQITVTAPHLPGEYAWSLFLAPCEAGGVIHEEASLPLPFKATPHCISLAVWEIPSPVVIGDSFRIKVGARSSGASTLNGSAVEVRDQSGQRVGGSSLGETPWPGTSALFWTDVELTAPSTDGVASWSVVFAANGGDALHNEGSASFNFAVVRPSQHTITVTVVEKESGNPIEAASVRVGPYRGSTNERGVAAVGVPAGTFDLIAWKVGYLPPSATVEVNGDVSVQLQAEIKTDDNPWAPV